MNLAPGARLGPYEMVEPLGKGGMGEVYKAKDTRLDRFVAVKILPAEWAQDAAMIERFDREAKAIASLNHPNICALHDLGRDADVSYLVMEYLEGETLAARIARGALGLDEALDVAVPIANALDQAHRRGVIHRDLKPGNIMLTKAGPKLLDFGLARAPVGKKKTSGSGESGTVMAVPTTPLTVPGLLIGTLQYMAPEQLDGLEADARTDIFAFGVVLHEMITGRRAFEGKSQVLLISAIATTEPPPLSQAQPATPPALEHVVKTCLAKNPDDRWQTARDLLAELEWIAGGGAAATAIMPLADRPRRRAGWVVPALAGAAIVAAALLAVPAYSYLQGPKPVPELRHRLWSFPIVGAQVPTVWFDVSANGRAVVFRADQSGVPDVPGLYVGQISDVSYRRLPGTDDASQPFWSADGSEVGFLLGDRLMRLNVSGDTPQQIARVTSMFGADWSAGGAIVYGSADGIFRLSAEGGTPEVLVPKGDGQAGLYWPHFLPDGRRFLYLAWSEDRNARAIMMASLDAPAPVKILSAGSSPFYAEPGYLIVQRGDAVFAQRFAPDSREVLGEPQRLAGNVGVGSSSGLGGFAASHDGVIVYFQAGTAAGGGDQHLRQWQPMWIESAGAANRAVGSHQIYRGAEVSSDGSRIALHRHDGDGGDVWIVEPSGTESRLTFDPARDNSSPIWSPDGQHIVFGGRKDDKWALYRRLSDGRGTEEILFESDRVVTPMSWSKDGQRIVFGAGDGTSASDLWVLTLESSGGALSKTVKPEAFAASPARETHGQISPDGRWLAYASDETRPGVYEVYVRPFPAGAGRWQVSREGGKWPRWFGSDHLLFMSNGPENTTSISGTLYRAKVGAKGDTFMNEPPVAFVNPIRAINLPHRGGDYIPYAVGPKGTLLIFAYVAGTVTETVTAPDVEGGLTVLRFWQRRR